MTSHAEQNLIYGRDAQLLETRGWVLERAGMSVSTATKLAQVEHFLTTEQVDLFILCHTLTPEEGTFALRKHTLSVRNEDARPDSEHASWFDWHTGGACQRV